MFRVLSIGLAFALMATGVMAQQILTVPQDGSVFVSPELPSTENIAPDNSDTIEYDVNGNIITQEPTEETSVIYTTSEPQNWQEIKGTILTLRGLDKISGLIETFKVEVGKPANYQRLTITVDACYSRPPDAPPESTAFIRITDGKFDPPDNVAFSGWMFASSPALSAMDHPRYDVWVLSCNTS